MEIFLVCRVMQLDGRRFWWVVFCGLWIGILVYGMHIHLGGMNWSDGSGEGYVTLLVVLKRVWEEGSIGGLVGFSHRCEDLSICEEVFVRVLIGG